MHRRALILALGGLAVVAVLLWRPSTTEKTEAPRVQKLTATSEYRQPTLAAGTDAHAHHHHPGMSMDMQGAVMGENKDRLPQDCPQITEEVKLTVHAGRKHARRFPGLMFAYDQQQWHVRPCSRVTVTFVNDDDIRHQWMLHGLPKYIHPQGMFHLEVTGPGEKSGTFIVPSVDKTYFVHCDMAQHTEKGLKAQLKAGAGNMDLPSIPGLTATLNVDSYPIGWSAGSVGLVLTAGFAGALIGIFGLNRAATAGKNTKDNQFNRSN